MKKISLLLSLLLIALTLGAQTKQKNTPKPVTPDPLKEGFVKATVLKYEVESCGYILVLDGKTKKDPKIKLQPENMDVKFKKNKLKVWVKYVMPKVQPMTTCMAGQVVKIEEMKIRK
jgi:hypothetical protein